MKTTATKTAKANAKISKPTTGVRKSRFTEFWEKYPNGCGEILDYKAILK